MTRKTPPKDLLDWMGVSDAPDWSRARLLGRAVSFVLLLLFLLALGSALVVLGGILTGGEGSLGAGALIVAILSAPFLIWGTWIKHRTLGFQKEGHLTDRLAKAVEQLGAEKTVKKIVENDDGNPVTRETTEPNLEVRIGGLLSLERIAQDSVAYDKGRDHVRVMEIICAYIRNNAPANIAKKFPLGEWSRPLVDADGETLAVYQKYAELRWGGVSEAGYYDGNIIEWARSLPPPRVDIMVALTVLERRSELQRSYEAAHGQKTDDVEERPFEIPSHGSSEPPDLQPVNLASAYAFRDQIGKRRQVRHEYQGYRLDLRQTCLQRAQLCAFRLGGVLLDDSRLEGAQLGKAQLTGARLEAARLDGANLQATQMAGTGLRWARFDGAILIDAQLEGARLGWAVLEGACLEEARLEVADLRAAKLTGADLGRAKLEGANLSLASLNFADLNNALLEGANFYSAELEGANLWRANLNSANFEYARLERAKLDFATLDGATFRSVDLSAVSKLTIKEVARAFGDASVVWPDDLGPKPAHWPNWELDISSFDTEYALWLADPSTYTPPPPPTSP
ncbi:pentapeptide repeat-containing protein [uncultured Paracoccus sp.]|uniref:pentapeptide repeat-containing protein n=1 Tax=uncultured Paracoccus sp. TaxID=189685 RepID=UPI0026156A67|nr:pentapeptide repeat-containing protein [uncultured Paracoccus sp.]